MPYRTGIQSLLLAAFFIILINNPYVYNSPFYTRNHFLYALIIVFNTSIACVVQLFFFKKKIIITEIDIILTLILIWILFSRLITQSTQTYISENVFCLLVIANLFLFIRLTLSLRTFLYGLSLVIIIQSLVVCYQLIHNYELSNFHLFITGTLHNSGLLSGLVVIIFPCLVFFVRKRNRYITYLLLLTMVVFLLTTQSRAALIAFIPVIYYSSLHSSHKLNKYFPHWLSIIFLLIIVLSLTIIKQPSTLGRLLIWKISIRNSLDSFFTGVGFGRFPKEYQNWHIDYFTNHQNNLSGFNATDLPNNTFNEPLQIFIETGLIGIFLWFVLSIAIYKSTSRLPNIYKFLFRPIFLSFFIFSLFSYPLHSLPILFVFICTLSVLNTISNRQRIFIPFKFARFGLLFIFLINIAFLKNIHKKSSAISSWIDIKTSTTKTTSKYESIYPYLKENPEFLYDYGLHLYNKKDYLKSLGILNECYLINSDLKAPLLKGNILEEIGNLTKAKEVYRECIISYPLLLRPKYALLKLYIKENDTFKAYKLSENIINSEVRVHSKEAKKILYDATQIYIRLSRKEEIKLEEN